MAAVSMRVCGSAIRLLNQPILALARRTKVNVCFGSHVYMLRDALDSCRHLLIATNPSMTRRGKTCGVISASSLCKLPAYKSSSMSHLSPHSNNKRSHAKYAHRAPFLMIWCIVFLKLWWETLKILQSSNTAKCPRISTDFCLAQHDP